MDSVTEDQTMERLCVITQLLTQAATQLWTRADQDIEHESLGLGVYLAQALASRALPENHSLPELSLECETIHGLLTAAEELSRLLPVHRPDLVPATRLSADLCDLAREARDLGC